MTVRQDAFPRNFPRGRGFTLIELAIAMFVFGMILILFGAIFPVATRAGHTGGNYAQATFLAQHKIDQLRNAGAAKLDGASLVGLGLIDQNSEWKPDCECGRLLLFHPNG